ncbi:MAG: hypothetical protein HPY76_11705 [Anaerolineae bacterium]|nr:hypothetical protein [Anaerolineae bacterium]
MGQHLTPHRPGAVKRFSSGNTIIWLLAAGIAACFGIASYLLIFANFYSITQFILPFLAISVVTTLLVRVVLRRVILPGLRVHGWIIRLIFLVFALTGAIVTVLRAPSGLLPAMVDKIYFKNPYLQRAFLQETDLSINVTGERNPAAGDSQVVLYYMTTQNGDVSFQAFDYQGDWTRDDRGVATAGDAPAALTWRGRPGSDARLVFQSSPQAGMVELSWQGQTRTVDLYAASENEVIVDLDYQVQLYGYAQVVIAMCFVVVAGFLLLTLFILLQRCDQVDARWKAVVVLFFLAYLVVGMFAYQDYGLSWDEPAQRRHGMVSARYVAQKIDPDFTLDAFENVPDLPTYRSRNYGVAFTMPLAFADALINFSDTRDLWLFRHFATFLFFYLGVAAFYKLLSEKFEDQWLALVGAIFYVLSPRIFAESFYNVKDTAFLAAFTIALLFAFRYWRRPVMVNAVLFGSTAAFATNIRVVTVLLVGLGLVYAALRARSIRTVWLSALVMGLTYGFFVFLLWPATWENPIGLVTETFTVFSDYTRFDYVIMFRGEPIRGNNVPAEYIPVWIAITTPLLYVTLFGAGVVATLSKALRSIKRLLQNEVVEDLVFFGITVLPVLAAIIMQSTLYTAWRHFFFIYSSFIVLALCGLEFAIKQVIRRVRLPLRTILTALLSLWVGGTMIFTGYWMYVNHPYQYAYFSDPMVAAFGGRENFERDYWGLSLRQGLERILAGDDRVGISYSTDGGTTLHAEILTAAQRERLELMGGTDQNPDYVLRIYRNPFKEYPYQFEFEIVVDGLPILTVYSIPK